MTKRKDSISENSIGSGGDRFDLQLHLPNLLDQVAQSVGVEFQNIYKKKYGLLRTDWTVLLYLGVCGRISAKDISEKSATHKTKVSRSVGRLEKSGYLTRERNETDRRWEILELSSAGQELFIELKQHAQKYEEKLMSRLTEAEGKMLRTTLQKLIA